MKNNRNMTKYKINAKNFKNMYNNLKVNNLTKFWKFFIIIL